NHYFKVADRKTAVLFGLACEIGAALSGATKREIRALSQYGRDLGIAFQIMDDVFDFLHPQASAGKAPQADIAARCLTLPIINAMEELGDAHELTRIMRGAVAAPEPAALDRAARAVERSQGLVDAYRAARRHALQAADCLQGLADRPERRALESIASYVVDRGFAQPLVEGEPA
ncbi:polyprenyl synthetase family protein, partial [Burkholderia pseudomallei]